MSKDILAGLSSDSKELIHANGGEYPNGIDRAHAEYLRSGGHSKPYPMTLTKMFRYNGYEYGIDTYGVIHQLDAKPYVYDSSYVATYDTPEYVRNNETLQALRLGFIIGAHGSIPGSLCDVGYGNGAFLKAASIIPERYGKDVTGVEVEGVELVQDYPAVDVITFHDCLEHIPDLTFVKDLRCKTVVISLPWCHYHSSGKSWFDNEYKHRKENEHLHHFNEVSLKAFMKSNGWIATALSFHEDIVRKSPGDWLNILTMAFKRDPNTVDEYEQMK